MDMNEFAERAESAKAKLYKTALLYLGDPDAAEEALDEAIYRGLKGCKKIREPEFFDTWLTRILINSCYAEMKRRRRRVSYDTLPESAEQIFDSLPLDEALRRLPKELKDVIILRFFSGHTLKETSEILDIPQGTAVTRQRRALKLLRMELDAEEV